MIHFRAAVGSSAAVVYGRPGNFESAVLESDGPKVEPREIRPHTDLDSAVLRARILAVELTIGAKSVRQAMAEGFSPPLQKNLREGIASTLQCVVKLKVP